MKVAYIYPVINTIGGAERVIIQKANYLADCYGYEVYLITASQFDCDIFFPLSENVKHIDLRIDFSKQYQTHLLKRSFLYLKLINEYKRKLTALLNTLKLDVVLTAMSREVDFLHKIKDGSVKIAESHTVRDFVRNLGPMKGEGVIRRFIANIWERRLSNAVRRYDALVVLTEKDAVKWSDTKVARIIPNPFPFYPKNQSSCLSKKAISVGRLGPGKRYDYLIRAWRGIVDRFPDWTIHVYGQGPQEADLKELIAAERLNNNFFIEKPVSDIHDKYLESSFFVMTSAFEGLPMVLIEALACGLPAISFDCPVGPSEIITHEKDGFLVEDGNITALVERMSELISDAERRQGMGTIARENVVRFHPDTVMQKWKDLFDELITNKRS